MIVSRNEHTIASSCEIRGRGYWSGRDVSVLIEPARMGTGIQLVRGDLPNAPSCPALIEYRHDADLRTNIGDGDARFAMVEHLVAALAGLEIDNCVVTIDAEEFPGLDGSSLGYIEALRDAGLVVQPRQKDYLVIREPIRIEEPGHWIEALPATDGKGYFEYRLGFDDETPIPKQTFGTTLTPRQFVRDVALARTFVTWSQAAALRAQGVAAHVTNQDLLVVGVDGRPLDNSLRFSDEYARHKTLDLIGDLALTGLHLVGKFISHRGGHRLNGRLAMRLAELAREQTQITTSQIPLWKIA